MIDRIKVFLNTLAQNLNPPSVPPASQSTFLIEFNNLTSLSYSRNPNAIVRKITTLFMRTINLEKELIDHAKSIFDTVIGHYLYKDPHDSEPLLIYCLMHPILKNQISKEQCQLLFNTIAYKKYIPDTIINALLQLPLLQSILTNKTLALEYFHVYQSATIFKVLLEFHDFNRRIVNLNINEIAHAVKNSSQETLRCLIEIPRIRATIIHECSKNNQNLLKLIGLNGNHTHYSYINPAALQLMEIPELQSGILANREELLIKGIQNPLLFEQLLRYPAIIKNIPSETLYTLFISAIEKSSPDNRVVDTSNNILDRLFSNPEWKNFAIYHKNSLLKTAVEFPKALSLLVSIPEFERGIADNGNALFIVTLEQAISKANFQPYLASAEILFNIPAVKALVHIDKNKAYRLLSEANSNWLQANYTRPSPFLKMMDLLLTKSAVRSYANPYNFSRLLQSFNTNTPEQIKLLESYKTAPQSEPRSKTISRKS